MGLDEIKNLITALHLEIEVLKLNGVEAKDASSSDKSQEDSFTAFTEVIQFLDLEDVNKLGEALFTDFKQYKLFLDKMMVVVNTDMLGVCSEVNLDVEYALTYLSFQLEHLTERSKRLAGIIDECKLLKDQPSTLRLS